MTRSVFSQCYDDFRQLLIKARESSGLTQIELAEKLARPQSFVSKYERGERRLDVVEFLEVAQAIGIDPAQIISKISMPPVAKLQRKRVNGRKK